MAVSRFQRATALVPLALLSAAVTASLTGVGPTTAVADQRPVSALPDGSTVPTDAIEAPASLSRPGVVAPGAGRGADQAVATASTSGIPDAALSAYQRAETVINAADASCNIPWQLVAAIGRVESDHGRVNGNSLTDQGLATPGIYGIPLDGSNNTAVIRDTDAGQYDDDAKWDRAVGPMQFIPSTWSVVGVDGDNDGKRDPQDIDDAALATAVYLCSGNDDLSTEKGRRVATFRYNHSHSYVDLVLSFMDAYLEGDFTSVQTGTVSYSGGFDRVPAPVDTRAVLHGAARRAEDARRGRDGDDDRRDASIVNPKGNGPRDDDSEGRPDQDPGDGGNGNEEPPVDEPPVEEPPVEEPPVEEPPAEEPLTEAEASMECLARIGVATEEELDAIGAREAYNTCMAELGWPR